MHADGCQLMRSDNYQKDIYTDLQSKYKHWRICREMMGEGGGTGGKLKEENLGSLTDDQRHLMSEGAKAKGGWWT